MRQLWADQEPDGYWSPMVAPLGIFEILLGMGSCFYPMTHRNEGRWVLENHTIPNTPFCHLFTHWSRDEI